MMSHPLRLASEGQSTDAFPAVSHHTLTYALRGQHGHHAHFTDAETEPQRRMVARPAAELGEDKEDSNFPRSSELRTEEPEVFSAGPGTA